MPRTDLPSGGWVEWTDRLMASVRFEVKAALVTRLEMDTATGRPATRQQIRGDNEDRQRIALWKEIITAWSFTDKGIPVPKENVAGQDIDDLAGLIGATLDLDDYTALAEATQPLLMKVIGTPNR